MEVTVKTAQQLRLTEQEFEMIKEKLGRTPNFNELCAFSGMWSEHCSYKNSIKWLKTLPREGGRMLVKAGEENAGLMDIGDGYGVVFKIESHNHPSAIEPFQGAATGVGGIHRDIFTMGARPIAALNSLRFGNLEDEKTQHLLGGVVHGISHYGNCFGVPTVGGEVYFESCYHTNPLVNAMSVGIVKVGETVSATAEGEGNPVMYVGSATGKDGIGGASFASADITAESAEELPAVQVGDPFQEKKLLEACLEVIATGAVVGMQDMGAAGIICSTAEMSAKGGVGMRIDLDKVPTRQQAMKAWELLLSESLIEYQLLLSNPKLFITSFFQSGYEFGYGGSFFSTNNSWWSNMPVNFLVKVLAVFNLLSGGNYYINVVFYSFFTFWGPVALYRVMKDAYPFNRTAVIIATFLLPSFIYWTSGIHKDGVLFTGIILMVYHFYFGLKQGHFSIKRILVMLLGLLLILAIRNFVLVMLLPALFAWWLATKNVLKPFYSFALVYAFYVLVFFTAKYMHPSLNFPAVVVAKQQQFLQLKGKSAVPTKILEPTVGSFITAAPNAISTSVLRPNIFDVGHFLSLAAVIENIFFLLLFVVFLIWHRKTSPNPFGLFCLFFAFSLLLTIGYTVHFLGATVRYRSVVLPFLIVPLCAVIDWKVIGKKLGLLRN